MSSDKFIDIRKLISSKSPKLVKWIPGFVISYLKRILHEEEINNFLVKNVDLRNQEFCQGVVDYFDIEIYGYNLHHIPKTGPVIIVMNHPLGGMDAMALVTALRKHRTDLKFIVNDLLMNLENLKDLFVGVNKHGKNDGSVRQQISDLFGSEQAVCIFPAGLVSRKTKGIIKDPVWKKTFVTYARNYDRLVIPVHIEGRLSNFFYRLSNFRKFIGIKANIEMLYLSDEMFRQRGKKINFVAGEPFYIKDLPEMTDQETAQIIKERVYALHSN